MLKQVVKDFLTLRLEKGAKILLGLSGGADSMALLHLLVESKETLDFSLHVAHVDHGWREESAREAEALKQVASHLKLSFHLHRLEKMKGGDLENRAREERLAFFSRLHKEEGFQALLLAHHAGDQAETVFKRIAEGAGLKGLGGLYEERLLGSLCVWRPLLSMRKEALIHYLNKKKLHYFEDATNQDTSYLRSRMRVELFPQLEKIFGKRMEGNFAKLGKMCQELSLYFEERGGDIEKKLVHGPFGAYLDLRLGIHSLELKYFLKGLAPFSYDALEVLMKLIRQKRPSGKIHVGSTTFQLSRSHLFIYQEPFPSFFETPELWKEGGDGSWEAFWQGEVAIPKGNYSLEKLSNLEPLIRKKIKKGYGAKGVPSFFYDKLPIFAFGSIQKKRNLLL
ncbi:tRNA lysidine(34) synthetase TilS [Candidatus Neptunochlamydia vexilliferae]|nr:tRNA lysidine(34) synthetase TilS [Candidatus Neptunochlamydia vexilliferae]